MERHLAHTRPFAELMLLLVLMLRSERTAGGGEQIMRNIKANVTSATRARSQEMTYGTPIDRLRRIQGDCFLIPL
jgi:hypothetical protein